MCARHERGGLARVAASTLCVVWAIGCAVGPDFVRPAPPASSGYTAASLPAETVRADDRSQRFAPGAAVPPDWWRLFRSEELQARIARALAVNPTLAAARASLRRSEHELRAGYAVFFPQLDAGASAGRQRAFTPIAGAPRETFDLYTVAGTIEYTLDVFGGERRSVEAQRAEVDFQTYETAAAYLSLVGNVVNATIAEGAYVEQLAATRELVAAEQDQVDLLRVQADAGTLPYTSVLLLETQLDATEAQLPALEQRLAQTRHLLATLCGEEPAAWTAPAVPLAALALPEEAPFALPSELVGQRPDILAAEAQLHQASATIGVATAALLPHVTLTGEYGWEGGSDSVFFSGPNAIWQIGAQLATPVIHGGALWYARKAAIDAYEQSLATYRQTVLGGLEQVADTLRALEHDAQQVEAQARQEAAARDALRLTSINYQAGTVGYVDVLISNAQMNQTIVARVAGRAQRLQDTVALLVAVGGGWWDAKQAVLQH